MTPERELYERQLALTNRGLAAARREALALASGAKEWGIVITIEMVPLHPPAMGNTLMMPSVRISRSRQQELEAMLKAAEASEVGDA